MVVSGHVYMYSMQPNTNFFGLFLHVVHVIECIPVREMSKLIHAHVFINITLCVFLTHLSSLGVIDAKAPCAVVHPS